MFKFLLLVFNVWAAPFKCLVNKCKMWTDEFTASINIELAYDTLVFDDHKEEINGENKNYGNVIEFQFEV